MIHYNSQRYLEYLSSYHFYPNSIDFRIVSSKAIEKFKNVQSFQLNQLINSKFYFPQDRREILLLKYDMWSRWLVEVENFFIERHEDSSEVTKEDLCIVIALAKKTSEKYTDIMTSNDNNFNTEFITIWIEAHESELELFFEELQNMNGSYGSVFQEITDILCEISQCTLAQIYELNEIFKNKDAGNTEMFLIISKYSTKIFERLGVCITSRRIEIYKKYFNFNKIWLKNYTDDKLPHGIIKAIELSGIEIDYKKCTIE